MTRDRLFSLETELLEEVGLGSDPTKVLGQPILIIVVDDSSCERHHAVTRGEITSHTVQTTGTEHQLMLTTTLTCLFGEQILYLSFRRVTNGWTLHVRPFGHFGGTGKRAVSVEFPDMKSARATAAVLS